MASTKRVKKAKEQFRIGGKFSKRPHGPIEGDEPPDWVAMRIGDGTIRESDERDWPAPRLRREVLTPRREGEEPVYVVPAPKLRREVVIPTVARRAATSRASSGTEIQTPWATILVSVGIIGILGVTTKKLWKADLKK